MIAEQVGRGRGLCKPRKKYSKLAILYIVTPEEIYYEPEIWRPVFERRCKDGFDKTVKESSFYPYDYDQQPDRTEHRFDGSVAIMRVWKLRNGSKRKGAP